MAHTIISTKLPPDIDPTKARLAYGTRAIPKLNEQLNVEDLLERQKALSALCDVLHNPESIMQAIQCSIVVSLVSLLHDSNDVIRMKTTEAMCIMARHAVGREALIKAGAVTELSTLFSDLNYDVRLNTHTAIERLSATPPGPHVLVEAELVASLVRHLSTEEITIQLLILSTLHACMRIDSVQALSADAMVVYTKLLGHESPEIRASAAMDIKELSTCTEGKEIACHVGAVAILSKMLHDKNTDVRIQATAALNSITITTQGKHMTMECNVIQSLLDLLEDEAVGMRLNALKLITNLSESVRGRKELMNAVERVCELKKDAESAAVRKSAQIAEKSIRWKA